MDGESSSGEGDNGLGVEKESDVTPDAECGLKLIGGVCGDRDEMLIFFKVFCAFWSEFVVGEEHFRYFFPFFWSIVVFYVLMLIDMFIVQHDVKALIDYFSVFLSIDEVSDCVSV